MKFYPFFLSFCLILFLPMALQAQKLSKEEKKILEIIHKNHPQAVEMLEKAVNINSGTLNVEGVREVAKIFDEAFRKIGLETRWIEMPKEMNRAGHLFAEHKGKKGKRLLLIGHLDTVFEKDSPFQKYQKQDSIAYAPGGQDMKGGNIIILFALRALYEAALLDDAQIVVALTGDEESTGNPLSISRKDLVEVAKRSDVALCFEAAIGMDKATVGRRGIADWAMVVRGKRAHSAGIFKSTVGAGAIYEASRILNSFYTQLPEKYLTFNAGMIAGGSTVKIQPDNTRGEVEGKHNVVPQTVVVNGDIRFISEEQKLRTINKMKEIIRQHLPHTSAQIHFEEGMPAMSPKEGNYRILEMLSKVSQDMGLGEVKALDPAERGAGDVSFVAQYVDCLDGLGAGGKDAHSLYEYIDLRTFETLTARAALLIYRLTRKEQK